LGERVVELQSDESTLIPSSCLPCMCVGNL
jgi:hypothetical protein